MEHPKRIRLSRARGWRLPDNAVNCARPGKWGNLFVVGRDGTRAQCVAKLIVLQQGFVALHGPVSVEDQLAMWRRLQPRSIAALKGRDLACWCPLDDEPCHCDLYLHLANGAALPAWARRPIDLPRPRLGMAVRDLIKLQRRKSLNDGAPA